MKRKPNVSLGWETEDIVNKLKAFYFWRARGKMDQMMVRAYKFEGKSSAFKVKRLFAEHLLDTRHFVKHLTYIISFNPW